MMISQLQFQHAVDGLPVFPDGFVLYPTPQIATVGEPFVEDVDLMVRTAHIKEHLLALNAETIELLDMLPWKPWKSYSLKDSIQLPRENLIEARYEAIDILHFWMNIAMLLGMGPDMIYDMFMRKQKENRDRQTRGY